MQLAMPEKPDVEAASHLYDRIYAYVVNTDISTPESIMSRIIELAPSFKSFIESIEKLTVAKMRYDTEMDWYLVRRYYTIQEGAIVWNNKHPSDKKHMTDQMHHIDSLRSKICDNARAIMTITYKY